MLRSVVLVSVLLGMAAACGGTSVRSGDDESGGRTQTGGESATGGAFATGGVPTTGGSFTTGGASGTAGSFGGCSENDLPSVSCIRTCYAEVTELSGPECRDGRWQCPVGMLPLSSCPANSCANIERNVCCDRKLGTRSAEPCNATGERAPCPAETERIEPGGMCLPDGIDARSCHELEGLPCPDPAVQCNAGSGCSTNGCYCSPNPQDGRLTWSCWIVLC